MSAIIEPFFTCLVASIIWAPIVFLVASRFHSDKNAALADKLWPAALFIAALPALMAPLAASLGISLRAEPPLPPMAAIGEPAEGYVAAPVAAIATPEPAMDIVAILQASAALYVYGFLLFLALGLARLIGFSYRVRYAFDIDEPRLEAGLESWRRRMGLKRRPRYAFTDAVSSVCVHGFFRPVILMPMNLLERVSVNDAVLMGAHEMAHIKRRDTWLFAFTKIVKAIFWFNPFMHRISARAHLAAEQAADALVIDRGVDRRQYAKCFVEGLRFAAGLEPREYALVPSFTPFDKRSRRQRLDAILSRNGGEPMLGWPGKIGLTLSIAAAGGLAFAQAAFAVAPKPPAEALPEVPVEGEITFGYGEKDKKLGPDRPTHEGVDIAAARGAPVRAAGDGKVIDATGRYKGSKAWGNVVVVDHGHGLITRYAHLDSFIVRKGDTVEAGDTIGAVGATGVVSGPHLHFEIIQDGFNIDPTPLVAAEPAPAPRPAPVVKSARAVTIALAPEIAAVSPTVAIAPHDDVEPTEPPEPPEAPTLSQRINEKLTDRLGDLDERLDEIFDDFDKDFEGFAFEFDDLDFDAFADAQVYAMNAVGAVRGFDGLSENEREEIREAHREAMEAAREAKREMEQARRDMARAGSDEEERRAELAERRAEKAFEQAERMRERAMEEAERMREQAMEKAERAQERALEQAERRRERALERIERAKERKERAKKRLKERIAAEEDGRNYNYDYDYDYDYDYGHGGHDEEHLAEHEKALRKAKAQIEQEIARIERRRDALKQNSDGKTK